MKKLSLILGALLAAGTVTQAKEQVSCRGGYSYRTRTS